MSASLVPMRSFEERIKRFVGDCQRIIIAKRAQDDLERREAALRIILTLGPEIEPESGFSQEDHFSQD